MEADLVQVYQGTLLDHMYILMHSIFHAMLFIDCMLKPQNVIVRLSLRYI